MPAELQRRDVNYDTEREMNRNWGIAEEQCRYTRKYGNGTVQHVH
jgi:hypothetical protein